MRVLLVEDDERLAAGVVTALEAAGFVVETRSADMAGAPFDDDSAGHVTVYRLEDAP